MLKRLICKLFGHIVSYEAVDGDPVILPDPMTGFSVQYFYETEYYEKCPRCGEKI